MIFPQPSFPRELPIMNVVTFHYIKSNENHGCIGRRLERIFLFIWNIWGFSIYWHKIITLRWMIDPCDYIHFLFGRGVTQTKIEAQGSKNTAAHMADTRNCNHHSIEDGKQPERKCKDRHSLIMEQSYSKDKQSHHSSWKKPTPKEQYLSTAGRGSWGLWGGWESQGLWPECPVPSLSLLPQRCLECYCFAGPFLGKCLASLPVI